ncbi:hypothetical protein [Phenylobacterium sp.]|uniref:hypothetical protein n=1 Tax=Phenylobacterium sp. TaxID=1871053 RepID=UPI0027320C88|nr:hypothetical protein [Phenylobacterium sp.]MDP1616520.1 hypothetical protein [Phenylobacterium sp.]MDP1985938.1 hypothetical protein [Phenylobacterium sp.]
MFDQLEISTSSAIPHRLDWLPSDRRIVLTKHKQVRRSVQRVDGHEILCSFAPEIPSASSPRMEHAWGPYEQIGLLRPGAIFEKKQLVGSASDLTELKALRFRPQMVRDVSVMNGVYHASVGSHPDEPPSEPYTGEASYCVGMAEGRRIYIPCFELIRFYFGTLSAVADRFMANAIFGQIGEGIVDPAETKFVDDGVFQIAPLSGFADKASALRLAMLLTSPDLLRLWQRSVPPGERYMPQVMLPPTSHSLMLVGRREQIRHMLGQWEERAFLAWSITSDFRPSPFRKLIIKSPFGTAGDEVALEDTAGEAASRYTYVVPPSARLQSLRRPGARVGSYSPFGETVRQAFPGLSRVTVEYSFSKPRRPNLHAAAASEREVEELSFLAPGHDKRVGGLSLRPTTHFAPWAQPERPTRQLFDEEIGELARLVTLPAERLASPVPAFLAAMRRCASAGTGGLELQDLWNSVPGGVTTLAAPRSWGVGSKGRFFVVGSVRNRHGVAYAFELVRRNGGERISLGVVARADGAPLDLRGLSAIAKHAVSQIAARGEDRSQRSRGLWPSQNVFSDVVSRPIPHTRMRMMPATLANDLQAVTEMLTSRTTEAVIAA